MRVPASRCEGANLEAEVAAEFDSPWEVSGCRRHSKRAVLNTGIHARPGSVIEGVEECSLECEIHLPVNRDHLGNFHIGVDPLRSVKPHQRAKCSSVEIGTDVLRVCLSRPRDVLRIKQAHQAASSRTGTYADLAL